MHAYRISVLAALTLLASQAAAQEPAWLTEARAREGRLVDAREIRSKDGWFTARVPAKLGGGIKFEDEAYSMAFDIGTDTPVNCEVIRGGFDPANLLRAAAGLTFEQLEPIQGKIANRSAERVHASAVGLSPLLEADWIYTADDGSGARAGGFKQAAALKGGHGIYCTHVELGYSRTFREIVHALVESIEMPDAEGHGEAYFVEIGTMRVREMTVGISVTRLVRDEEGDTRVTMATSMLLPGASDAVQAQDTLTTEWVHPDGTLINTAHVELSNGEIGSRLGLFRADDGDWRVEGEHMGKPIEQAIASSATPSSTLQQAWLRRELLAGGDPVGRELAGTAWLAADPTRFSDWGVRITGAVAADRFEARETIAGLTFETTLEPATGLPVRFSMPLGPLTLVAERATLHGRF